MNSWVPTALGFAFVTALAAGPSFAGSCPHSKSRNCLQIPPTVDFSSVPNISDQIVGGETAPPPSPASSLADPQAGTPYTGPMVGVSTRARAPTVGYYWSIN